MERQSQSCRGENRAGEQADTLDPRVEPLTLSGTSPQGSDG